jgi:chromate transporter
MAADLRSVSLGEAVRVWARIGLLGFGGPAGQIALMHRELVEKRRWIDEPRFLHALNYCMLLPGPEAQQLATYIGWLMHKTRGGLVAGTLFVLPGFVAILALSMLYAGFKELPAVSALFFGLKAAVLAIVVEAVQRIGKRALKGRIFYGFAAFAFVGIFFFEVPFPLLILSAGALGLLGSRVAPQAFPPPPAIAAAGARETVLDQLAHDGLLEHTRPSRARALRVLVVALALWGAPIALLAAIFGPTSVFVDEAAFFSQAAVVTFGGAYAVLAFIAQQAVDVYGWLAPGEMLDGLGLAETTPGPLIMVVQFVGFLGAFRDPGTLSPMVAGLLGSVITVWVTFVPCFLWIFLGAPYIEALRGNRRLHAAMSAITAAVVGVILNLSIWFALHVVFGEVREEHAGPLRLLVPTWSSIDVAAAVLSAAAMVALLGFHVSTPKTLAACAALGAAWRLAT